MEPPIKTGTPDPYTPPKPGELMPETHLQIGPIIQQVTPVLSGNKEHPTAYFLDGLAARLMEESLLSVLLALRRARLDGGARESFIAWPGLLFTKNGTTVDGDLLVSDGSTVSVFECKMNASRLELDQTRRLLDLCEELRAKPGIAGLRGDSTTG